MLIVKRLSWRRLGLRVEDVEKKWSVIDLSGEKRASNLARLTAFETLIGHSVPN